MSSVSRLVRIAIQTVALLLAFVPIMEAFAESANPVVIEIELSSAAIHPGEPLELILLATRSPDSASEEVSLVEVDATGIQVTISDVHGSAVCSSVAQHPRLGGINEGRHLMDIDLRKVESNVVKRAFQEWCSTELPTGHYTVQCALPHIKVTGQRDDDRYTHLQTVNRVWRYPLQILDRDDDAVRGRFGYWAQYAEILVSGKNSLSPNSTAEHAIEMVVYAKTPLAVPYQLRLLQGNLPLRFNHIFDLACQLVSVPQANTATELLKTLESGNSGDWWKRELMSWMIFKLHESGDPEITAITKEYVETHKRPIDPDKGAPA